MTYAVYISRDDSVEDLNYRMGLEPLLDHEDVEVTFLSERDYHTLHPSDLEGANAVVSLEDLITGESVAGLSELEIIAGFGAGLDNVDIDACTEQGIAITNSAQGPRPSVAQSTLGMMLVCASNLLGYNNLIKTQGFEGRFANMGTHLYEKQLGIIGFGLIGSKVCELVEPFDMDVKVHDPYAPEERIEEYGVERVELGELLETSDFVTLHCGLNEGTRNMLGTEQFERMKSSAYLINTTRGGLYPDAELAEAIREGEIAGAAIDVFEDEPHVEGNPLLELDDVLTTPHSAGVLREGLDNIGNIVSESILNVKNGEVPKNIVNPEIYDRPVPSEKLSPSYSADAVEDHYRD